MSTAREKFKGILGDTEAISENYYEVTTAKRVTLTPPQGIKLYDIDQGKDYIGDGSTVGGKVLAGNKIRTIATVAATGVNLTASPTTDKIDWPTYGAELLTGDSITVAAGSGTLPSGVTAAEKWVIKDNPTDSSFKIATTRANALTGTAINILSSGVPGWTAVITSVCADGSEDVFMINPVSAAIKVNLRYPTTGAADQITVKRIEGGTGNVAVSMLGSNGAGSTLIHDGTSGDLSLVSGSVAEGYTLYGDPTQHEYFSIGKLIN